METQTKLNEFVKEPFNWSLYNKSQTQEKILFLKLLKELTETLPIKYRVNDGKPLSLRHIIFCLAMRSYCVKSGRRVIGELELCKRMGYIDKVPHFNSIFNYLDNPNITLVLEELIKLSSLPLRAIEKKFCCDSSGFGASVLDDRWSQIRQNYSKHHRYYKAHVTFGVLTNIVTSCKITEGTQADAPMLPKMAEETSKNFNIEEFSADKGYLSRENYNVLFSYGALPLIPFKSNVTGKRAGGSMIWTEMYNFFKQNNELFMKKYHLRSNAEAGFFMIKQRFGDLTNCRKETSAKNEVLVKILCHNLCVLVQEIFNLGIDFNFAQIRQEVAQAGKL